MAKAKRKSPVRKRSSGKKKSHKAAAKTSEKIKAPRRKGKPQPRGRKRNAGTLPRQQDVLKRMSENVGKRKRKSQGQAMKESGYSDSYSENPQRMRSSQAWRKLLDEELGDSYLTKTLRKVLDKKEIIVRNEKDEFYQHDTGQPHSDVIRALIEAFKLKDKYGEIVIRHKHGELSDAELEAEIAGIIQEAIELAGGEAETKG